MRCPHPPYCLRQDVSHPDGINIIVVPEEAYFSSHLHFFGVKINHQFLIPKLLQSSTRMLIFRFFLLGALSHHGPPSIPYPSPSTSSWAQKGGNGRCNLRRVSQFDEFLPLLYNLRPLEVIEPLTPHGIHTPYSCPLGVYKNTSWIVGVGAKKK